MSRTRKVAFFLGVLALVLMASLCHPVVRASGYRALLFLGVPSLRSWAIKRLKAMRGHGAEALGEVVLDPVEDPTVCLKIIYHFRDLGPEAALAVPALIETLTHKHRDLQDQSKRALKKIVQQDPSLASALAQAMQDPSKARRAMAAMTLGESGIESAEVTTALVAALQDPEDWVQESAVRALAQIRPQDPFLVPALIGLLESRDSSLRVVGVRALGAVSRGDSASLSALARALDDRDGGVRITAVETLRTISLTSSSRALPYLRRALKHELVSIREVAVSAMRGASCLPALMTSLEDFDLGVRLQALRRLKDYRAKGAAAIPALIKALDYPDPTFQATAMEALEAIAPAQALRTRVFWQLKDEKADVRKAGVETLSRLDPKAELRLIPALIRACKDKDRVVREAAVSALEDLETPGVSSEVSSAFIRALRDRYANVRLAAVRALAAQGRGDPAEIKALTRALEDSYSLVREIAEQALENFAASREPSSQR